MPCDASAMRAKPRLVPSASTAASSAALSAAGLPVRRCVKRSANPVQASTSLRTSVMRTRGSIPFRPDRQIARRLRHGRFHAGDIEHAVLDLDTVEFAAPSSRHDEIKPFMKRRGARLHKAAGIGLLADAAVPRGLDGEQVVLEGAVIA